MASSNLASKVAECYSHFTKTSVTCYSYVKKIDVIKKSNRWPLKKSFSRAGGTASAFFLTGFVSFFFSVPIFLSTKRTRAASDFGNPASDFATCHRYQVASEAPDTYRKCLKVTLLAIPVN